MTLSSTLKQSVTRSGLSGPSHPKFVGLCQHHLEHGHESRGLAEVAAADDMSVDVEALCVGSRHYGPHKVMKSSNDGGGELQRGTVELCCWCEY